MRRTKSTLSVAVPAKAAIPVPADSIFAALMTEAGVWQRWDASLNADVCASWESVVEVKYQVGPPGPNGPNDTLEGCHRGEHDLHGHHIYDQDGGLRYAHT